MADKTSPSQFTTFSDFMRYQTRPLLTRLGQWGAKLGFHPDMITVAGLMLVMVAALLAGQGLFFAAGILMAIGGGLDTIDGAVARATNRRSRFGALLDSSLDRYADGFIFVGIAYYFASRADANAMLLTLLALLGAYGVSYVRARAEGLGIGTIKDGLFDRLVRVLIMIVTLIMGWIIPGLVILAIGSNLTAFQRIYLVYQATRADGN